MAYRPEHCERLTGARPWPEASLAAGSRRNATSNDEAIAGHAEPSSPTPCTNVQRTVCVLSAKVATKTRARGWNYAHAQITKNARKPKLYLCKTSTRVYKLGKFTRVIIIIIITLTYSNTSHHRFHIQPPAIEVTLQS